MARSGQRIESPCSDETILFRKTAADTDGALLEFEVEANAGAHTITHIHCKQEERFLVVRGQLNVYIDGQYLICGPGEEAVIPMSIPHRWWNESGEDVRMIVQLRPALNAEGLFETLFNLGQAGKLSRAGIPNPLRTAVLLRAYREEFFYIPWLPVSFQRILAIPGAIFGSWFFRYRPTFSQSSVASD